MTREERFCDRLSSYVEKIVAATEKHHGLEPGSLSARHLDGALWSWLECVEQALAKEQEVKATSTELRRSLLSLLDEKPRSQRWFVEQTEAGEGLVAALLQDLIDQGLAEWVTGVGYRAAEPSCLDGVLEGP